MNGNRSVELFVRDTRAVCPKCSGMVMQIKPFVHYRCMDCKTFFVAMDHGYTENGVIVTEVVKPDKNEGVA